MPAQTNRAKTQTFPRPPAVWLEQSGARRSVRHRPGAKRQSAHFGQVLVLPPKHLKGRNTTRRKDTMQKATKQFPACSRGCDTVCVINRCFFEQRFYELNRERERESRIHAKVVQLSHILVQKNKNVRNSQQKRVFVHASE